MRDLRELQFHYFNNVIYLGFLIFTSIIIVQSSNSSFYKSALPKILQLDDLCIYQLALRQMVIMEYGLGYLFFLRFVNIYISPSRPLIISLRFRLFTPHKLNP